MMPMLQGPYAQHTYAHYGADDGGVMSLVASFVRVGSLSFRQIFNAQGGYQVIHASGGCPFEITRCCYSGQGSLRYVRHFLRASWERTHSGVASG